MRQVSAGLNNRTSRQRNRRFDALPTFIFRNGYTLETKDLGNSGVKIELIHEYDAIGAIILPPKEVGDFGRWLLQTLGQDQHSLPKELGEILDRLSKQKKANQILKRGDKTRIRDALKILKS